MGGRSRFLVGILLFNFQGLLLVWHVGCDGVRRRFFDVCVVLVLLFLSVFPLGAVVPSQSGGSDSSSAVMVWTRKSRGG